MTGLIPQSNHRSGDVVLVPKSAQARRAQHKEPAVDRRLEPKPTRREYAHEVPARENQDVARHLTQPLHNAVGTHVDLLRRFSAGTPVAKEFPIGTLRTNLCRSAPLIL